MTKTIKIALTETEMQVLAKSAALDCRRVEEQARFLLRTVFARELAEAAKANSDTTRQGQSVAVRV